MEASESIWQRWFNNNVRIRLDGMRGRLRLHLRDRCYLRGLTPLGLLNTVLGCLLNRVIVRCIDDVTGRIVGWRWHRADEHPPTTRTLWVCGRFRVETHEGKVWEFAGVFSSRDKAVAACRTPFYFIAPVALDYQPPHERTTWPGTEWPRAGAD